MIWVKRWDGVLEECLYTHLQIRYTWIHALAISVVPAISNSRTPKIIFCARAAPESDTFEECFCAEARGRSQRQIVKHCIKEIQVLREEEHDDLMLDVMGLFRPLSYTSTAESKYQRKDKAPRLEYNFMPASTGVNDLFDNFFMDKKGSGLSDSGQKNNADEWNADAERCVQIAEKDTLLSTDQIEWKNALLSEFESHLRLTTYNFFIDYRDEPPSGGVLVPLCVPPFWCVCCVLCFTGTVTLR